MSPPSAAATPVTAEAIGAFLAAVRAELPGVQILDEELGRERYREDQTAYLDAELPAAVALPASTADVAGLMRLATAHRVPVVPRGAGTGLSGGSAGLAGAVTIVMTRMDEVLEIDRANLCVVTQPGILNADLKRAVEVEGLFYAPDPASYEICSIGGNLATNAGGLCCVKYGQTRDSVLGLEVVLADGTVVRTGGRNVKDVAGYSLTHLFVGSGGTLGIITEATLRLRPLPPPRSTLLAFFPTLDGAGAAVAAIMGGGLAPVTLELMDQATIAAVEDWHHLGLDVTAAAMLMVESDLAPEAAADELDRAEAACRAAGAGEAIRSRDPQEADMLRNARRLGLRALERLGTVRMEDVGVPRARVPEMLRAIEAIGQRRGIRVATFGHAGDGNLHPNFIFDRDDPDAEAQTKAAQGDLYAATLALGGTVTAEHGIGSVRKDWLETQVGPAAIGVMRSIKAALDPLGLLNPGRIV